MYISQRSVSRLLKSGDTFNAVVLLDGVATLLT